MRGSRALARPGRTVSTVLRPAVTDELEWEAAWMVAALVTVVPSAATLAAVHGRCTTSTSTCPTPGSSRGGNEPTVAEVVVMWRTIDSLDWSFDGLSRSWSVSLGAARHGDPGTHVGRFHREAPRWFEVLSQEIDWVARDYFGGPPDPSLSPAAQDAIARLKALGVRTGSPIDTMTGNRPIILVGTVGTADGRSLNEVVTEAALANIDKLRRAEADERHLLVWVDSTDNASEVAMVNFSLPQEAPDLPDGLDGVGSLCGCEGKTSSPTSTPSGTSSLGTNGIWSVCPPLVATRKR